MKKVKTTSAVSVLALFDIIIDNGFPAAELEMMTGIKRCKLEDPDARITMDQFLDLWEIAERVSGDSAIGLHLRKKYGTNLTHFVVILAMNSSTLLEGLKHWIRYSRLICETDKIELADAGEHFEIRYTNTSPEHDNRWMPEHHMSLAFEYALKITGKKSTPVEVHFKHADPGYSEEYRKIFKCPVYFEQEITKMVVKKKDLFSEIPTPDFYLQAILIKHAEDSMKVFENKETVADVVTRHIIKNLPKRKASASFISSQMNMDRTTLHRQLKNENISFKQLVTDTRKTLVEKYFKQGLTITQSAYLLGFSEPSAFQRAFKRWFGVNPGKYKNSM